MPNHVAYRRVSTLDQNAARQLEGVHVDNTFEDHVSGKDVNRPQLQECLRFLRPGDTLHVHSIDRLARNLQDLLSIISGLTARQVTVCFQKEGLTFKSDSANDPFQRLQLQVIGAVAEFERSMIRERQREGIAVAKHNGKHLGRRSKLTPAQAAEVRNLAADGMSKADLAVKYGVSRQTIYAILAS